MTTLPIVLDVNGERHALTVEPRTHLADVLREQLLLTGTHLGCEHGVCGACTVELDGAPARSCIAHAGSCDGSTVRTIEGFADDAVMAELRENFTAEHALQCGYCTPGMLIVARDIVLRLPDADEARVREELAGNLCRCTGYRGIVRAILAVLGAAARMTTFTQAFTVSRPAAQVWGAFRDTAAVVACLPGAALDGPPDEGGGIAGTLSVKLGPMNIRFAGRGQVTYDDAAQDGSLEGQGADRGSGSRAKGRATFALAEVAEGTRVTVAVDYTLTGTLAQFARGSIVDDLARRLSADFARNLEGRLAPPAASKAAVEAAAGASLGPEPGADRGVTPQPVGVSQPVLTPAPPPDLLRLLLGAVWRRLRGLFGR